MYVILYCHDLTSFLSNGELLVEVNGSSPVGSCHLEVTLRAPHGTVALMCRSKPPALELISAGVIYQATVAHRRSSCVTRCSPFIWQCGCCFHASDDKFVAAGLFYITGNPPTVHEQWMMEHSTHGQAFPHRGARIMSDSGRLGARTLAIRWLQDLKRTADLNWTVNDEGDYWKYYANRAELSRAEIWCGETTITNKQTSRQTTVSRQTANISQHNNITFPTAAHTGAGTQMLFKSLMRHWTVAMSIPAGKHKYRRRKTLHSVWKYLVTHKQSIQDVVGESFLFLLLLLLDFPVS